MAAEATKMASQILFQNSLAEVVRKLRTTTKSETEVIEQCLAETRKEITSTVQSVKVTAVLKAVYFSMLGYSAAYGAFNIIEVMADKSFGNKRIGYMAACLTFTPKTDVLPLLTALLKRDLCSGNFYEVGLALYCIATICTRDLARDLVADVVNLLNHPRNYVRKKAVLSLYRIFFEYPDALRLTYHLLKEKVTDRGERCDNDPAVRGAVVCVLCELARRNPANFLSLAVPFFSMLSTVHSNWTLIKIVKVFGYFAPLEPRLGKKLVDPITNLIQTTGAKSVQYECILAVANGMSKVPSLTKLAAEKVKLFVEDPDQNLKYLGLDAMCRMLRDNPKLLSDQRDLVIASLDDADVSVRKKALEIMRGLVTKKNLVSTISNMMRRCVVFPPDEEWSNCVIATIIEVAQTDDYSLVQDFVWYTSILLEISLVNLSVYHHGALVQNELVTVMLRVNAVRQFGVQAASELLKNTNLLKCDTSRSSQWKIIKAAALLCGEYPYWLKDKRLTCELLLSDHIAMMHPEVQVACVTAVGKIAAYVHKPCPRHVTLLNGEEELALPEDVLTDAELREVIFPLRGGSNTKDGESNSREYSNGNLVAVEKEYCGLELFRRSIYPDVQDRAQLVFYQIEKDPELGCSIYAEELLPVALGAQSAVVPPDDLELDEPFCKNLSALLQLSGSDNENDDDTNSNAYGDDNSDEFGSFTVDAAERQRRKEEARRQDVGVFYINNTALRPEDLQRRDKPQEGEEMTINQPPLTAVRVPRKTQVINRNLLCPAKYVAAAPAQRRNEPNKEEEDEATKRFRDVDVTRALAADEKLPEAVPYAQLLQTHGVTAGEKNPTNTAAGAFDFEPIVLLKDKHLSVTMCMESCRVCKDGTRLMFCVEISNLDSSNSIYDPTLCIQHDENNFKKGEVLLGSCESLNGNGSKSNDEKDKHINQRRKSANEEVNGNNEKKDGDSDGGDGVNDDDKGGDYVVVNNVYLAERIKSSMSVQHKVVVKFKSQLPASLASPLTFGLCYKRKKKAQTATLQLLLSYSHFARRPKNVTPDDFQKTILLKLLATAPIVSGFVNVNLGRVSGAVPEMLRKLRLRTVEVFKDVASFYGTLHARRSSADDAHIAVLLREEAVVVGDTQSNNNNNKGIAIAVKAHQVCLAELLVQEIASLLMQEAT